MSAYEIGKVVRGILWRLVIVYTEVTLDNKEKMLLICCFLSTVNLCIVRNT